MESEMSRLALSLCLAAAGGALSFSTAEAQPQPLRRSGLVHVAEPLPNRYVVVVETGSLPTDRRAARAAAVAAAHGVSPARQFSSGLAGFAFVGSEEKARKIAGDPA